MPIGGSVATRDNAPELMQPGLRKIFYTQFKATARGEYKKLYRFVNSDKRDEDDMVMAGLGGMQPLNEGGRPAFDMGGEAWKRTFIAGAWGLAFEVTQFAIDDDQYNYFRRMTQELGAAAAYTQEVQSLNLFNDPALTQYTAGGTAFPLASRTHYQFDGGSWSNKFAAAKDLDIDSLQEALTLFRIGQKSQRSRTLSSTPRYLFVGPSDEWNAHALLNTAQRPGTDWNDVNSVRSLRNLEPMSLTHMTDDRRWYITDDPESEMSGRVYNQRMPLTFREHVDPITGNRIYVALYRCSWGAVHPVGVFCSVA